MTGYQAEVIVGKLREAESLLMSLESEEPENEAVHDAKIFVWKAIDKVAAA